MNKACVLIVGLFLASTLLTGCGGGGGGGGGGSAAPFIVSGTVQAPQGQIAFYPQQDPFLERLAGLFDSSANASVSGISPVANGTPVELVRTDNAGNVLATLATAMTSGGNYSFNLTALGLSFSSNLVVQVVNTGTGARMRAFVVSETVNIDPVSEAAVQMVLEKIASNEGVTLENFTPQELNDLAASVDLLTTVNQATAGADLDATVTEIKSAVTADTNIMVFIASASGTGQTTEGPGDIGNYFPFTPGNIWRFQGTISESGASPVGFFNTSMITGIKAINGVTATIFTETSPGNALGEFGEYYLLKDSRGIAYRGNNDLTDLFTPQIVPYQLVTFPLQLNSTFEQVNKKGLDIGEDLDADGINEKVDFSSQVTVIAFEEVDVPVGSFPKSVRIESKGTFTLILSSNNMRIAATETLTQWFAPGVGPVKRVDQFQIVGESTSDIIIEELIGFIADGHAQGVRIELTPSSGLIKTGDTLQFTAVAFDQFNTPISGVIFTWNSSNLAVTTMDSNGELTGISSGVTTITASAGDVISNPATVTVLQPATFGPVTNFAVGYNQRSIAVGDFNGDGKLDLAVTSFGNSNSVAILLGNGDGTFGAATNFAVGVNTYETGAVVTGDFNGDGKLDLAVANTTSSFNGGTVSILPGNGDGTFGAATNFYLYPSGASAASIAIGDFNGDGKLDLAVSLPLPSPMAGYVAILIGNGDGTFGAATNFAVGVEPVSIAIGDFNGDGKPDLAVANSNSRFGGTVSILIGNGDGTFGAATDFAVGGDLGSVVTGDFNRDRKLDLVVGHHFDYFVSILLGAGTGSFGAATNVYVGGGPASVTIGDFNGDGKLDLAVGNNSNHLVSVLLGAGTGSFLVTNFVVEGYLTSVAVGDFDGNGKLDLVGANSSTSYLSIFLNTTP